MSGQYRKIAPDPRGTWYRSNNFIEKVAVSSTSCVFDTIVVSNKNASTVYIYLYDAASATGTPIMPPIPVSTGNTVVFELPTGYRCATGLYVAASSSQASYVALASNDISFAVLTGPDERR